ISALREESIAIGAEPPLEQPPEVLSGNFTQHAAIHRAVRQHGLDIRYCSKMIALGRDAVTAFERITHQTARRAGAGHWHEERVLTTIEKGSQHLLRNARLERDDAQLGIEIHDACQPRQI